MTFGKRTPTVSQNTLVREIGAVRQAQYPDRTDNHASVWRALEYATRRRKLLCVDVAGKEAPLQRLPTRPKGMRKVPDEAKYYLAENYFMLEDPPALGESDQMGDVAGVSEG